MSVYKRGDTWWYSFIFAGNKIQESAKTHSKTVAKDAERQRRRELEQGFNNLGDSRADRVQTIAQKAKTYLAEYKLKHPRSAVFAQYAVDHITQHLGERMLVDINDKAVKAYQVARLKQSAAPKTINEEVGFLLRLLGDQGDAIRARLRRERALKLNTRETVGKVYSQEQEEALLGAACTANNALPTDKKRTRKDPGTRSPFILPALELAFNAGMRNAEIRQLTWGQIDFEKRFLTVGRSKTQAGEGRTIPLNGSLLTALTDHARWYTKRFGKTKPDWYVFPGRAGGRPEAGRNRPYDPTRPVTTLKTSWRNAKTLAGVAGRFHDTRHTLITELAEDGAGDQTIMDIAGHVSRRMLARYSHIQIADVLSSALRYALEHGDDSEARVWLNDLIPSLSGESVLPNPKTVDLDTPEAFANGIVLRELIDRSLQRENLFDGIPELVATARADFPKVRRRQGNGHLVV